MNSFSFNERIIYISWLECKLIEFNGKGHVCFSVTILSSIHAFFANLELLMKTCQFIDREILIKSKKKTCEYFHPIPNFSSNSSWVDGCFFPKPKSRYRDILTNLYKLQFLSVTTDHILRRINIVIWELSRKFSYYKRSDFLISWF